MQNLYQKIRNFDLLTFINRRLSQRDKPFWCAFATVFLALNLLFIYHGAHFLFGDHDWRYLKHGLPLNSGLFEGRFSQFILINILSQGELLPIINNLLGFTGFALGISLLAKYWQLPHNKTSYTLFALFTAVTPYLLSFMYFAFLIAPVLSWNAFIIGALMISEKEQTFSLKQTLPAVLLILLALGGYPPVINLIAVVLSARILFAVINEKKSFKTLCQTYRYTVLNIILALIIYKICLIILTRTGLINSSYYNLQTTPIAEWGNKFLLILKDMFKQFTVTLPFITAGYKVSVSVIALLAFTTLFTISKKRRIAAFILFFALILSALFTTFISTSRAETEFSPRIDFFGLMYVIAAFSALILKSAKRPLKNITIIFMLLAIFISAKNIFTAQKVWHLGFISEMNFYRRVGRRFQKDPLFNMNAHYIIVQGGTPSFRPRFYHTPYQKESDDLLGISYVPGLASGVMWNYYAPYEYADNTSYVYTFRPDEDFKQKLLSAKSWPAAQSIHVGGYWILLPLTNDGLEELRQKYLHN